MVKVGESKIPGCVTIHKMYGSSSYSVEEMSRFIDSIIQECIALDIDVYPQEKIEKLLRKWGGAHG